MSQNLTQQKSTVAAKKKNRELPMPVPAPPSSEGLGVPPKLLRNVVFNDGHAVERFLTLGSLGILVMFLEVGNVFGMGQIFFACIYFKLYLRLAIACHFLLIGVASLGLAKLTLVMKFLEVMDLVLVFIVAMMSWPQLGDHFNHNGQQMSYSLNPSYLIKHL